MPDLLLVSLGTRAVAQVAISDTVTVALADKGQLWVWGQNAEGQLGLGDFSQRNQPTVMEYMLGQNVVNVAAGAYHTLILTGDILLLHVSSRFESVFAISLLLQR